MKTDRYSIKIVIADDPVQDIRYWLSKTPEERISAVEILREQMYAIMGHVSTPKITKIINIANVKK